MCANIVIVNHNHTLSDGEYLLLFLQKSRQPNFSPKQVAVRGQVRWAGGGGAGREGGGGLVLIQFHSGCTARWKVVMYCLLHPTTHSSSSKHNTRPPKANPLLSETVQNRIGSEVIAEHHPRRHSRQSRQLLNSSLVRWVLCGCPKGQSVFLKVRFLS